MLRFTQAFLAVIFFLSFLPAEIRAQPAARSAEQHTDGLAICDKKEGETIKRNRLCDAYIDNNLDNNADMVKWILEGIDNQKAGARHVARAFYVQDQIIQWTLVVLGFLTTIAAAFTKAYPDAKLGYIDFALLPIFFAALMTAATSINAYYQFSEHRRLNQSVAYDLAGLESDIHFAILRHASGKDSTAVIDLNAIADWHERLKAIMQRYAEREAGDDD